MAKVIWINRKRKEPAKSSSCSLDLLPCPVCHRLPNLRFWGDSDYYFECHIARNPLALQEHFPTMQMAAEDWNEDVRYIKKILEDVDAVPVVRCKDCKYYDPEDWGGITCKADGGMTDPDEDSFCSRGERSDDNGCQTDKT